MILMKTRVEAYAATSAVRAAPVSKPQNNDPIETPSATAPNALSSEPPSRLRVKSAVLTSGRVLPVYPRLRTSRRDALTEAMGHEQIFVRTCHEAWCIESSSAIRRVRFATARGRASRRRSRIRTPSGLDLTPVSGKPVPDNLCWSIQRRSSLSAPIAVHFAKCPASCSNNLPRALLTELAHISHS